MYIVATGFPQQNIGIDDFLFTCIEVPTPQHGNEISTLLCRNFIPTSLSGKEIPKKWHGNEIPTNCLWELYTIYNPAPRHLIVGQARQHFILGLFDDRGLLYGGDLGLGHHLQADPGASLLEFDCICLV